MSARSVDPSADATTLVGRRSLLRGAGAAFLAMAVLGACRDEAEDRTPQASGSGSAAGASSRRDGTVSDIQLLNTALSIELLLLEVSDQVRNSPLVERESLRAVAGLAGANHVAHRDRLVAAVNAASGVAYDTANALVDAVLVTPRLTRAESQADVVTVAADLEQLAAQMYVHLATVLDTPVQRQFAVTIGAVSARHAAAYDVLGELGRDRPAVVPTDLPVDDGAVIPDLERD